MDSADFIVLAMASAAAASFRPNPFSQRRPEETAYLALQRRLAERYPAVPYDILDIGPASAQAVAAEIAKAGTVIWNGPVGVFEFEAFGGGTRALAEAIAKSGAFSIAGGGDTLAAIGKYGVEEKISYISTGGGAFLEFVEGKTLPAVAALERRAAG